MSQDPSNWGQSKNDVDNWSKVGQTGDGGYQKFGKITEIVYGWSLCYLSKYVVDKSE